MTTSVWRVIVWQLGVGKDDAVLCSAAQSCLTLCNPMSYSPPGSSVHGISQARILEWVAISFSTVLFYLNEILKQLFELLLRQIVHIYYLGSVTEKLLYFSVNILVL